MMIPPKTLITMMKSLSRFICIPINVKIEYNVDSKVITRNIQLIVIVISQYVAAHMSCNLILIINNFRGVNGNIPHDCNCAYMEMGTLTVVAGDLGIGFVRPSSNNRKVSCRWVSSRHYCPRTAFEAYTILGQ